MNKTLLSLTLGLALLAGVQAATAGEIIFSDNFSANSVNPPTLAKPGVKWVVDKGDHPPSGPDFVPYVNPAVFDLTPDGKISGCSRHVQVLTGESFVTGGWVKVTGRGEEILHEADGRLIFELPFPLNSPVGTWKVNLRELASGKEASGMISVKYT